MAERLAPLTKWLALTTRDVVLVTVDEDGRVSDMAGIEVAQLEGLPESAHSLEGPDYWMSKWVKDPLEVVRWKALYAGYHDNSAIVILCRIGADEDRPGNESPVAAHVDEIRQLVEELRRLGEVRGLKAAIRLSNRTSLEVDLAVGPIAELKQPDDTTESRAEPPHSAAADRSSASPEWLPEHSAMDVPHIEDTREAYDSEIRKYLKGVVELPGLGGYGCVARLVRQRNKGSDRRTIDRPETFGLRPERHPSSLHALVVQGRLKVVSIHGHGHDEPDSIRIRMRNPGPTGVPVHVSKGTVFEQKIEHRFQDLTVKSDLETTIQEGEQEVRLHGLCMNGDARSPSGQEMLLTPWILEQDLSDQDRLWEAMESAVDREEEKGAPPPRRRRKGRD